LAGSWQVCCVWRRLLAAAPERHQWPRASSYIGETAARHATVRWGVATARFRDAHPFKNGTSIEAIAQTLEDGLTRDGSQMPRFDHLSARERQSLALFVISIRNQSAMDTSRRTP
jgi:hypothetical protein